MFESLESLLRAWTAPAASLAIGLVAAVVAFRVGTALARRMARDRPGPEIFIQRSQAPGLAAVALLAAQAVLQSAPDGLAGVSAARHGAALLLIAAFTWLAVRLSRAMAEVVALRYPIEVADNLGARRIQTQTRVLTRTLASIAILVGVSFALLTFPGVRNIGASLLASAGIAGLVVGLAAKPMLGNLLAGLQIAVTQPIRIDDVVVVEGEFGRIEEINRAYVVVAVWDQRRLIVPLQQFIEKPFQNWTRATSEILGSVFFWVDYGTPLEPLRAELRRVVEAAPEWDRRVCVLQVTDANERAMQLRALVSSADASRGWDLRCLVRERMIEFVRREHPESLPRLRAALDAGGDEAVRSSQPVTGTVTGHQSPVTSHESRRIR